MTQGSAPLLDAVVIGGGFYGVAIAVYLATNRGFKNVSLIERESALLTHASYNNQARVHNGYHYPRSFTTAYRSRVNLPRFVHDWPNAVKTDFTKLYAIARRNSKVSAAQFQRFCKEISAQIEIASPKHKALFNPQLIEEVFLVQEYAFDAKVLASWAHDALSTAGIAVQMNSRVNSITQMSDGNLDIEVVHEGDDALHIKTRFAFNCTYSGLNQINGNVSATRTQLKHEITEMALMRLPDSLVGLGITVMDGPFFSVMPFPARNLHTLSHVRYTPHMHWQDKPGIDPYECLAKYDRTTRVDRMMRDVARYLPAIQDSEYVDSLFEVKTVLVKNEGDDGRPILFERDTALPQFISILGGKIDNIYDALERLDSEIL